jgi:hypothetical protein
MLPTTPSHRHTATPLICIGVITMHITHACIYTLTTFLLLYHTYLFHATYTIHHKPHTHTHIHTYIHTYTHTHIHHTPHTIGAPRPLGAAAHGHRGRIQVMVHIHIYTHIHTYIHIYTHTHTHVQVMVPRACTYTYTYIHITPILLYHTGTLPVPASTETYTACTSC